MNRARFKRKRTPKKRACSRGKSRCAPRKTKTARNGEARKIEEFLDTHRKLVVSEIHLADFSFGDAWQNEEGALTDQVTVSNLDQMCFKPEEEGVPPGPEDLEEAIKCGAVGVLEGKTLEILKGARRRRAGDIDARRRSRARPPSTARGAGRCASTKTSNRAPRKNDFDIETAVRAVFYLYDTDVSNAMATRSRENSGPTVEAIASDGGLLPRNVNCQRAYRLYRPDPSGEAGPRLSGPMLAAKLSYFPARMLGLVWNGPTGERPARRPDKGHLSVGADADLTLLHHPRDPRAPAATDRARLEPGYPFMAFSEGRRTMYRGKAYRLEKGRPAMLITAAAVETLEKRKLDYRIVDLARDSLLYRKAFE